MNRLLRFLGISLLLVMAGCKAQPSQTDVIELTYGSPFSSAHPFSVADKQWIAEVEKRSGGRIRITPYWGGSMVSGDHNITELRHGLTDMALISPIYARSGMTLIKAQSGFYGGARTIDEQLLMYHCAASQFPDYAEELRGVRILAVAGGALIHVITRDRPIRTLADLNGLRIRAPSELLPVLRPLGVDVLTMPMGEVYSALSKGMIDGVIAPADTLRTVHFGEVAKHFSAMEIPRGAYPARAIRDQALAKLPADLQKLLIDLQPFWEDAIQHQIEVAQELGYEAGRKDGIIFHPIDPAEQARFNALYRASADRVAASLDTRGIPGTAVLGTIRSALASGQCVPRAQ